MDLFATGWHDDLSLVGGGVTRYFRVSVPSTLSSRAALVVLRHGGDVAAAGTPPVVIA